MHATLRVLFLLSLIIFFFSGCSVTHTGTIKDGYHQTLPLANMRTVVWGNNQTTVNAATVWLQKVGLTVIEPSKPQESFDEQRHNLHGFTPEETQVFYVAKRAQADYLVMVDTIMTPTMVLKRVDKDFSKEGDKEETVTVQKLSVAVLGLNVRTTKVDWSGLASNREAISEIDQKLRTLTWEALGVAWGVQSTFTQAELRGLKNYQLMSPAIDIQTFPQGIQ